ncbi:MAG: hypothetical protein ABSA76_15505 [Bacteroidales bacterium]
MRKKPTFRPIPCFTCTKLFIPKSNSQKYCSDKCKPDWNKEHANKKHDWYLNNWKLKKSDPIYIKQQKDRLEDWRNERIKLWGHMKGGKNNNCQKLGREMEEPAKNILLNRLGFSYVNRFADSPNYSHSIMTGRKLFPFDFYCEKNGEKWLIECTCSESKRLDKELVRIFRDRIGLRIGIIFMSKKLQYFTFKEISEKWMYIIPIDEMRNYIEYSKNNPLCGLF